MSLKTPYELSDSALKNIYEQLHNEMSIRWFISKQLDWDPLTGEEKRAIHNSFIEDKTSTSWLTKNDIINSPQLCEIWIQTLKDYMDSGNIVVKINWKEYLFVDNIKTNSPNAKTIDGREYGN